MKEKQQAYNAFVEANGLKKANDRTQVFGYNRSVSGKVAQAGKKGSLPETIRLKDVQIHRSVGAKGLNYEVMDLRTGEKFHFVEGTKLQDVTVFAGKGSSKAYRNAYKFAEEYGGNEEDWQHVKGIGVLDVYGDPVKANIHWSQCEGIGKFYFFVKEWLE